jgi:hypothetical protein
LRPKRQLGQAATGLNPSDDADRPAEPRTHDAYVAKRLRFRHATVRGWPAGERHHSARWSDDVVAAARELRAAGTSNGAIARALGVPRGTVEGWTARRRRVAMAVRVIATTRPTKGNAP